MNKHTHRGITFFIGHKQPWSSLEWHIPKEDYLGRATGFKTSSGAFYDGCEDHPEGAEAWAEANCRAFIDKLFGSTTPSGQLALVCMLVTLLGGGVSDPSLR